MSRLTYSHQSIQISSDHLQLPVEILASRIFDHATANVGDLLMWHIFQAHLMFNLFNFVLIFRRPLTLSVWVQLLQAFIVKHISVFRLILLVVNHHQLMVVAHIATTLIDLSPSITSICIKESIIVHVLIENEFGGVLLTM